MKDRKRDLLNYTSYLIISKYKKETGEPPHGLYFNKIMSLCHRNFIDKEVDIGLSHYWYRYGDQVHKYSMPSNLVWNHESPTETKVEWKYEEPLPMSGEPYDLIDEVVSEMIDKYIGDEYQAVRDVYKYAPFDFQKKYLDLREIFYGRKNAFNWDNESYKRVSKPIIISTFSTFPNRIFPELNRSYKVAKNFIEMIVEKDDWKFKLLQKVCTNFWFLFCYHLRLNDKCRENIPRESISYWESRIEFENIRYRRIIGDFIVQATEKRSDILKNDLLKEEYIWRTKDLEEAKTIIDEFSKDFEGFGQYLDSN